MTLDTGQPGSDCGPARATYRPACAIVLPPGTPHRVGLAGMTVRFRLATLRCQMGRHLGVFQDVEMTLQPRDCRGSLGIMAPNTALRQARRALRLSQDEMAVAIRDAGQRLGTPNGCSKT